MGLKELRKKVSGLFEDGTPVSVGVGADYQEAKKNAEKRIPDDSEGYKEVKKYSDKEAENGKSNLVVLEYEEPERKGGGMSTDMVDETLGNDDGYSTSL